MQAKSVTSDYLMGIRQGREMLRRCGPEMAHAELENLNATSELKPMTETTISKAGFPVPALTPRTALTNAVNRAIANGSPVYENIAKGKFTFAAIEASAKRAGYTTRVIVEYDDVYVYGWVRPHTNYDHDFIMIEDENGQILKMNANQANVRDLGD